MYICSYALASNSLIKPAQQGGCLFLFTSENICTFNKHKQTLVTTKYRIIKQLTHLESTHDAEHNGTQLLSILPYNRKVWRKET